MLAQLAQPEYDDEGGGKTRIDKHPSHAGETAGPSPDAYDATILAFSSDLRRGVKAPVR